MGERGEVIESGWRLIKGAVLNISRKWLAQACQALFTWRGLRTGLIQAGKNRRRAGTMSQSQSLPTIYIVSGGIGASAEGVVHTLLAQFPKDAVRVTTVGNVRKKEQIAEVLRLAQSNDALIVYTLVDTQLQDYLLRESRQLQVQTIDLMGPLMDWVTQKVETAPKAQPGLYRQFHREYFDRVSAIDFTMAHDDGKNPSGWSQAEAVLVGVSRVGKTPLSVYLAVLGWKVANYPLVPQAPVPEMLFSLDPQRVFGITVEPGQLLQYRLQRQSHLGAPGRSAYVDPEAVYEEVEEASKIFRRGRFKIVDMTDKTIEMGADEIIRRLS
jgi:[pyruvate, water dikinase]-phosphate phosphotransferase / [pyruvate, water dikinase] kinase